MVNTSDNVNETVVSPEHIFEKDPIPIQMELVSEFNDSETCEKYSAKTGSIGTRGKLDVGQNKIITQDIRSPSKSFMPGLSENENSESVVSDAPVKKLKRTASSFSISSLVEETCLKNIPYDKSKAWNQSISNMSRSSSIGRRSLSSSSISPRHSQLYLIA